jgi:hypothetical protein
MTESEPAIRRIIVKLRAAGVAAAQAVASSLRRMWHHTLRKPPPSFWQHERFSVDTPTAEQPVTFRVDVIGLWEGRGTREAVIENIRNEAPLEEQRVRKELRELSRKFTPEELADFERGAGEKLGGAEQFCDGLLECHYRVEVSPDQALQDHLRKKWETGATAEADHKLKERALERLQPLQERWLRFLRELEADPLSALAVRLADDPSQLAEIIGRRASEQEYLQEELKKLCDTTSEAYRDMGVFDFVMKTDGALAALIRHLGIDQASHTNGAPQANGTATSSSNGNGRGSATEFYSY